MEIDKRNGSKAAFTDLLEKEISEGPRGGEIASSRAEYLEDFQYRT